MKLSLFSALAALSLSASAIGAASPPKIEQSGWAAQKKFVQLPNGMRMAYLELGDPKGPPLLLLHGYTDSSRSWSLVAPYLGRYRLIVPDQRGHGATEAPECCYGGSQYAYDARLLLDTLGVKRAAVAGHSMGSLIAMTMAAEYPERISAIVLIGSTALPPVSRGGWLYDNVAALEWPLNRGSHFLRDWHPRNQPTPVDPVFAEAAMEDTMAVKPHVWRAVMREMADVPAGRHAIDVKARVLILSGGKDPLFPSEHHAALVKAFPNARSQVFRDLGHNPNWEQPEAVGTAIDAFLAAQ